MSADEANRRGKEALGRKDYTSALSWFLKSADQGNAEAQTNIAKMYYDGLGVTQDYAQALSWYRKAAEQGDVVGQAMVGLMYHDGKGVTRDYATALTWLRKAADKGSMGAQLTLSSMYMGGEGVKQDSATAMMWLRKANGSSADPDQSSSVKPDITLWCEQPTLAGWTVKSLASIDTRAKYVKFETPAQMTLEYRDGFYGMVATGGPMMPRDQQKVHQFVSVDGGTVRFGFKNKGALTENSIDLQTGLFRTSGRVTQCTEAKAKR